MKVRCILSLFILPALVYADADQNVYYDNVVVVVDASGSMARAMTGTNIDKMSIARDALKTVLNKVNDNTKIGIIAFGRVNREWVYPIDKKDTGKLNSAIDGIQASGGTPLGEYIKKGADALLQQREKQHGYGSYRLLIVTDGEASDSRKVEKYVPDVISRGIIVDVIGVDMANDHELAKVAHSYRRGNNPAELTKAIQATFAEVSTGNAADMDKAFDLIAPIPDELAQVIVKSFANSGNHPIGEKPRKVVNPDGSVSYIVPGSKTNLVTGGNGYEYGLVAGILVFAILLVIIRGRFNK